MSVRATELRGYSMPAAGWAILGGFLGTLAFSALLFAAPLMGLPPMDLPTLLGTMFTTNMALAFWLGLLIHFFIGSVILSSSITSLCEMRCLGPTASRPGIRLWGLDTCHGCGHAPDGCRTPAGG